LQAKQFDALYSIEPYPSMAIEKGIARVLVKNARSRYIVSPYWAAGTPISMKTIIERPGLAKKLLNAVNKAVDYINNNKNEARKIIPKYTPLSLELAMKVNLYKWTKLGEEDRDKIQTLADMFWKAGLLKTKVDIRNIFLDTNKQK
jgi:ABC-type nitrate/sulfonate/bicarbonate transport system substrate-binding protein